MKKIFSGMLFGAAAAAVLLLMPAGCARQNPGEETVKTFIDALEDGSVVANFDKTEKGTGGGTGITIEGGQYLVIDTALTEGKVQVRVFRGGTDIETPPVQEGETPATIDYVFEGSGTTEYQEIQPGDYVFSVNVEEKASGTITASTKSFSSDAAEPGAEDAPAGSTEAPAADAPAGNTEEPAAEAPEGLSEDSSATASAESPAADVSAGSADAVDLIMALGTTQAFSDEPVPAEDVQLILQAGMAAESAINQQPWFFAAITNKEVMEEISSSGSAPGDGAMSAPPQGSAPGSGAAEGGAPPAGERPFAGGARASFGDSPLAIIVYMDQNTSSPDPAFDCGLAVKNMCIAAGSLGYGVKIVSSPNMTLNGTEHDLICEKLGVDPALTAEAVLLVGKPDLTADAVSGASTRAEMSEKAVIID
ncbi:MAG: nitroreductase family protein [Eubacteriales bacterium]|nr:nitroreductase family protein [Eubacteriales bacterium]